jgi:hypothetical protein
LCFAHLRTWAWRIFSRASSETTTFFFCIINQSSSLEFVLFAVAGLDTGCERPQCPYEGAVSAL